MTHTSKLHQRFMEAQQPAPVVEPSETAHGEAVTPASPAPVEAPVEAVPAAAVTEDLDANVLATGPRSVVCIQPNPDNAKATADAYEKLEHAMNTRLNSEFKATTEGLNDLCGAIVATNANGGFSPEAAYFANLAIEAHSTRIGYEDDMLTASVESALTNLEGTSTISTESLDFSLEGVDDVGKEMSKRWLAQWYRMAAPLYPSVKIAGGELETLIIHARKMKPSNGTIKVKKASVMEGDKVVSDVSGSYIKAAEILKYLVTSFTKDAKEDFHYNVHAVNTINDEIFAGAGKKWFMDRDQFLEAAHEAMSKLHGQWRDPRKKLGGNPSDPIVGNYVFFEDQSLKYKGDDAVAKKFDEIANLAYPSLILFNRKDAKDGGSVEIKALSPAEIVSIAESLLKAVKGVGFWRAFAEHVASSPIGNTVGLLAKIDRRTVGRDTAAYNNFTSTPELKTVEDALKTSNRLMFHVGYDATRVLIKTIKAFKRIAKLSLQHHAKAALESWDQSTAIDGHSVNETSPIEPTQAPGAEQQAPEGEVQKKQETFQDNAESKQDLNGVVKPAVEDNSPVEKFDNTDTSVNTTDVKEVQPATADTTQEVANAKLTGTAPTGVTEEAAAAADAHADGTPAAAVEPVPGDTDASVKDAKLDGSAPTGVTEPSAADADNKVDDAVQAAAVQSVGGDTTQTVKQDAALKGVAVESMQGPVLRVPYWFGAKHKK